LHNADGADQGSKYSRSERDHIRGGVAGGGLKESASHTGFTSACFLSKFCTALHFILFTLWSKSSVFTVSTAMSTRKFQPSTIKNKIKREDESRKAKKTKRQDKLQRRLALAKEEANDPAAKKVCTA
jgi:hypothetical protein